MGGHAALANGTAPLHSSLDSLNAALARYQSIERQAAWPALPDGPALRPGSAGPDIDLLRRRLAAAGDLAAASADTGPFDAILSAAVMRFQSRHGLVADGVVGRQTRAALNMPAAARARQIEANIARLRTLPEDDGRRSIVINVAAFDLTVFDGGRAVFQSPVIVGRVSRPTPTFSSAVTHIVTNPFWHVPRRLAVEDILPKAKRDPSYLREQAIRVYASENGRRVEVSPQSIDWRTLRAENFRYLLVQDPGPLNALGRIKFFLPNGEDVYLHDTPARELFGRPVRAFSSGCIRVERAQELARLLLAEGDGERLGAMAAALEKGETREIPLAAPVPVHIVYLTAWADEDGAVQFRDDVYGLDGPPLRQTVAAVNHEARAERCGSPDGSAGGRL